MSLTQQTDAQRSLFGDAENILRNLDRTQTQNEQGAHLPPYGEKLTSENPATRRDEGIAAAVAHADDVEEKWSVRAYTYMSNLLKRRGPVPFLAEDLIETAKTEGFSDPPDKRAWGGVFQKLARDKKILREGYALAKTSNLSPKVLWKRNPDWTV